MTPPIEPTLLVDQNTTAVLLSCGVYFLYVLLPLIPSVIIYKMFPETRTTVDGSVSNWKIQAGGAFAAYITVVLLGHFVIARTESLISGMSACTWTVHGRVKALDRDKNPVSGDKFLKTLQVTLDPGTITTTNGVVTVQIPSVGGELPKYVLSFEIPEFGGETIDLRETQHAAWTANFDKKDIQFNEVVIHQDLAPYKASAPMEALAGGPKPQPEARP